MRPVDPWKRFWPKVEKTPSCWNWTGYVTPRGYGRFSLNGRAEWAHRVVYQMYHGPIPEGKEIDHACRNRRCVNPEHLRAVTHQENLENRGLMVTNTSGVPGVYRDKRRNKWNAAFVHGGKSHYAGAFDSIPEAEAAVMAARLELHNKNDRT